jgi:hypothetical protein
MSLISRIFGKNPDSPARAAEAHRPEAPSSPAKPPRPDAKVVAQAEDADLSAALAAGDTAAIGRWVVDGSSTQVRQRAAHAVTDPAQVVELLRAARGKDKQVYRILNSKREAHLALEREARQREADAVAALEALEKHSVRAVDASYGATLARLETRWNGLAATASVEQRAQAEKHLSVAREAQLAHEQAVKAEAQRLSLARQAAEDARRASAEHARAAAAAMEAATEAEQRRIAELEAARQAEREAAQAKREADDAVVRELLGLLRQAQAALGHGGTARAARLRDALKARLPGAPALPPWFERTLQDVDARIEELKDWKTFTVVPKRGELVQRMQGLVGADMSPEELARQIRRLREEWRTLHRGADLADESGPEHEQFEQAAERAYEPCRAHFAQQAAQRKENQARREAILERLQAFINAQSGETPDWRAIQQVLPEARREWRMHAPVDQDVVQALQDRFHALLDPLQARLDEEFARNAQARRGLIERAARLDAVEDTRQAIDAAKALQQEWKSLGPVRRQDADALWQEFRGHCDAVFQRSANQAAAHAATLEAARVRAEELCVEAERLAATATGPDGHPEGAPSLDALQEEFESLELPRASARDLRQRFRRALDTRAEHARQLREAAVRRGWDDALTAAELIRACALATAQGATPAEIDAHHAAAAAAVERLEHAPKPARAVLAAQLAALGQGSVSTDTTANTRALRLLCVRAELLAGLESPGDDAELRREHQMQRLVASMGQGERHTPDEAEALALEWLAVGPVDPAVYGPLFARFERAARSGPG